MAPEDSSPWRPLSLDIFFNGATAPKSTFPPFQDFLGEVKPEIDRRIGNLLTQEEELDEEVKTLLLKGKRLRGGLLLYVLEALEGRVPSIHEHFANTPGIAPVSHRWVVGMDLACAVELAHSASLILDDMLDEDLTRRGLPALHLSRGQKQAMLDTIGVLTLPYDLAGKWGQVYTQSLTATQRHMASGVIRELIKKPDLPATRLYDIIITKKTGCLFGLSTLWGFLAARGDIPVIKPWEVMRAWRTWGVHVGKVMQIADDLVDLAAVKRGTREKRSWGSEALLLLMTVDLTAKSLVTDLKHGTLDTSKARLFLSNEGVWTALNRRLQDEKMAALQYITDQNLLPGSFNHWDNFRKTPWEIEEIMLGEGMQEG